MSTLNTSGPTEEHIRESAYYLWEQDGRPHGRDLEFWQKAVAMSGTTGPARASRAKAAPKAAAPKAAAKAPARAKSKAKA